MYNSILITIYLKKKKKKTGPSYRNFYEDHFVKIQTFRFVII